jgi:hypothetical protein
MSRTQRPMHVLWQEPYKATGTITEGDLVKRGTNSNEAIRCTAQGELSVGVAMEDAASGEWYAVCRLGRYKVRDDGGDADNGDPITPGTTLKYYADVAASGDYVLGYVNGDDGAAIGDTLYVDINGLSPSIF